MPCTTEYKVYDDQNKLKRIRQVISGSDFCFNGFSPERWLRLCPNPTGNNYIIHSICWIY